MTNATHNNSETSSIQDALLSGGIIGTGTGTETGISFRMDIGSFPCGQRGNLNVETIVCKDLMEANAKWEDVCFLVVQFQESRL